MPVHDPAYQAFLVRLRQARVDAKLTQVDVATELGRHQSFIAKSESGDRRVDVAELIRFAQIYRRPIGWFVGEE